MRYTIIVCPAAEQDIEESLNWYEYQIAGLGHDSRFSISESLEQIKARPFSFPKVYKYLSRRADSRFPHSLYFVDQGENIIIAACVHHNRDPEI